MKVKQKAAGLLACATTVLLSAFNSSAVSPNIVIAESYGGGGNSGATYLNDYVVLFNRGTSAVDINGWSIQYASAAGTTWQVSTLATTSTLIQPGHYFLVGEASGGAIGAALPTPDVTPTTQINFSGTTGKIALCNNNTALSGAISSGPSIVDFIGYGTANAFEGTVAPAPSNTTSDQRAALGCTDTDNNGSDFTAAAPTPRNSASSIHSCGGALGPVISGIAPASVTTNAGATVNYTVSLSQGDSPTFYWEKVFGGATNLVAGATLQALTLSNVLKSVDEATYFVIVSNQVSSATSSLVTLTVTGDPGIRTQPANAVGLLDGTVNFTVVPAASSPTYQWYFADSSSNITAAVPNSTLPSGDSASGATTATLTLSNLQLTSPTNFAVVINNTYGSVTSIVVQLQSVSASGMLAYWDFNGSEFTNNAPASEQSPAPYIGSGTATAVGLCNHPGVSPFSGAADPNDGAGAALNNHLPNFSWGVSQFPSNSTSLAIESNKTSGVQFNVSTLGAKNITISYESRVTATATKYARLQFTTNGTTWIDYPTSTLHPPGFVSLFSEYDYDLTGFPGVANNSNFGFRVVAETEDTASYGIISNTNYVGDNNTWGPTAGTYTFDKVTINGVAITNANVPPTITSVPDTNTTENTALTLNFTVGDADDGANNVTLSAQSLNTSKVNPGFSYGGSGASRTITITPNQIPDNFDAAPILVRATDNHGDSTATWFILTISAVNLPPTNTLTSIPTTNMVANTSLSIPFTLSDDHSAAGSITTSTSSDNQTVIPSGNVVVTGSGASRTLTITPAANQVGLANIQVTANDNDGTLPKSTTANISIMVRPNTNVVFVDYFNYDASGSLDQVSSNFWKHLSGGFGQMQVGSGAVNVDTTDNTENMQTALLGAPYSTNSASVIYASMIVNLANNLQVPQSNGTYVAVFNDGSGNTANVAGRLMVGTNGAAPGFFRLGIANVGSVATNAVMFPQDLAIGTPAIVVMKLVVSNANGSLWVNPITQASPSVTDTTDFTPKFSISDFELRESGLNAGNVSISHLKVGKTFDSVFPAPQIQVINGQQVVTWTDPTINTLQAAPSVFGTFTNITPVTSPYTNTSATATMFFRFAP